MLKYPWVISLAFICFSALSVAFAQDTLMQEGTAQIPEANGKENDIAPNIEENNDSNMTVDTADGITNSNINENNEGTSGAQVDNPVLVEIGSHDGDDCGNKDNSSGQQEINNGFLSLDTVKYNKISLSSKVLASSAILTILITILML